MYLELSKQNNTALYVARLFLKCSFEYFVLCREREGHGGRR
jgi:hypothetical protein